MPRHVQSSDSCHTLQLAKVGPARRAVGQSLLSAESAQSMNDLVNSRGICNELGVQPTLAADGAEA